MFRYVLSKILTFDNPFGISINISLNSFIKGGKTSIKIENTTTDITTNTNNKANGLGILRTFCVWLQRLHTIFAITKEKTIKSRKSLKVHIIKDAIKITANLKYGWLPNLKKI